jgi:uncharacterized protein YlxP (DUF503 family)
MRIAVLTVRLYAPWVHSLKEKRTEVKSLLAKLRNKFNVSAAEAGEQDTHQTIVIGIAAIAADSAQADSILDHLLNFIEANTGAEIMSVQRELL